MAPPPPSATTTVTTTVADPPASSTSSSRVLNAEDVIRLVPEVNIRPTSTSTGQQTATQEDDAAAQDALEGYDAEQIRLMEEVCIVTDEEDRPIGSASKKVCHLNSNIEKGLLHRAFSVFLFDPQNRLLVQQRATEKITFPDMWTNTCCSHPLSVPTEMGATLQTSIAGAIRAAQRKLNHELGISISEIPADKFEFLTRIHYKAASCETWGEHEIDYILLLRPGREVTLNPNENEVRDARFVSMDGLREMFQQGELDRKGGVEVDGAAANGQGLQMSEPLKFTPWFRLICEGMLFQWWERLDDAMAMASLKGETGIRRMC